MRRWKIKEQNEAQVSALCNALSCSHYFARILINRGYNDPAAAAAFLNVDSTELADPFLFNTMEAVVQRIGIAIRNREKITVYGDYDVDGITATSLLFEVLSDLGGLVDYYIPSRFTEGYGVNDAAVRSIAEKGTRLLITVDTGITAVKEVETAKGLGMDVIITDHHECQAILPDTLILNPKQPNSGYPFADLAGVGVVYKLVCALDQRFGTGNNKDRYTVLAAIGTVADIMPMQGENRYIVRKGLERLRATEYLGLQAMIDRCVGNRPIDTSTIGFVIAPRINAAGRMGNAATGVELFTAGDRGRAEFLVDELCKENNHRQEIENQIMEEAIAMLESDPNASNRNAIILWGENWHNGVVGIVASRLKDRYGKPCILFSVNGEHAKGSGRSVRPFSLFSALERISEHVEKFGGHAYAAGVLVNTNKLEVFRDAFCREVDRFLEEGAFDESIEIDCVLEEADLTLDQVKALEQLAPFGRLNETPIFCIQNVRILDATPTANGNHMRVVIQSGHLRVTSFYFNMPASQFCYQNGDWVDVVFEMEINTYNGYKNIQFALKDICYATARANADEFNRIKAKEVLCYDVPDRNQVAAVYRHLLKQNNHGMSSFDLYALTSRIAWEQQCELTMGGIFYSMQILRELGVLEFQESDSVFSNLRIHSEQKVNLDDSVILREIREKVGDKACV